MILRSRDCAFLSYMKPIPQILLLGLASSALASEVKESRDSAWTPEQSQKAFVIDEAYEIQLVASEPLIVDPVEIAWSASGDLYVAEMRDYPLGGPDGKPISRIQKLKDTDNDGQMDQAVTFAGNLDHAQGLTPFRGGLIVTTRTQVLWLKDTNGDGVADVKQSLIEGFNPSFSQLQVSSPRWGLDGHLYLNNGLDTKEIYPNESEEKLNAARHNLRWDPWNKKLHIASGFGQFGAGFDDWGHHFDSSNRSPVMFAVLPYEGFSKFPGHTLSTDWENIAPFGPASRVYPLQITHTTSDAHAGTNTSACGVNVYRGNLLPDLKGRVYTCDPTGQLITEFEVPQANGSSLITKRTMINKEFIRSKDEWFRPVNVTTGPDGALYICDIYRQYIDHARFFPDEFLATANIRSGENQGRIWRVVPKGSKLKTLQQDLEKKSPAEWVALLNHDNAWQRENAQRLLLESTPSAEIAKAIQSLIEKSDTSAVGKLHGLWTLAAWLDKEPALKQNLSLDFTKILPSDKEKYASEILENVVLVQARYPQLFSELPKLLFTHAYQKGNARSQMLYLALVENKDSAKAELEVLEKSPTLLEDTWIQGIAMGRFQASSADILDLLLKANFFAKNTAEKRGLLLQLTKAALASKNAEQHKKLFTVIGNFDSKNEAWWQYTMLQGLAEGLPLSGLKSKSLTSFIAEPAENHEGSAGKSKELLALAEAIFKQPSSKPLVLEAAVPLMLYLPANSREAALKNTLSQNPSPEVSRASLTVLRKIGLEKLAPMLYEILPSTGPSLKQEIITLLTSNPKTVKTLFEKMVAKEVPSSLVDAETRWRYLVSKDPEILALAQQLFKKPSDNREKVIEQYRDVADKTGDAAKGKLVFQQNCMVCHSFQGEGIAVGPDISDVKAKDKIALLNDILDPNRMIEARWMGYQVNTTDGRILVGIVQSESGGNVVLTMPGGITESIPVAQIASQKSLDMSLMPVGLEGNITPENMADLLSFLRHESPNSK